MRVAVADLEVYEHVLTEQVISIPGVSRISSRFAMKVPKRRGPAPVTARRR